MKNKTSGLLIISLLLLTMTCTFTSVQGEIQIKIIQGSAFLVGADGEAYPFEAGTSIRILVSDGQEKTITTKDFDVDNNLNFGVGFLSIDEGETVSFQIFYQGSYQDPSIVELNNTAVEDNTITITSLEIHQVNLYIHVDETFLPFPDSPDPEHNQQNVSIKPTLQWECNIKMLNESFFDVFLSTSESLTDSDLIKENITDTNYTLENPLSYETTYYWQVRIKDEYGNYRNGPLWIFNTKNKSLPEKPTNPVPGNESANRPKNQQLQWTATDPDEDNLTFDVYFGTTTNPILKTSNQTSTDYDPGILSYNTTYYWRIVSWNTHNQSSIGPLWQFTVSETNMKPMIPSNPQPKNETTGVSTTITLTWKGSDPDSDTVYYDIYVDENSPPAIKKRNLTSSSYKLANLTENTTYYWKIVSIDAENATQTGPIWSFTTEKKALQAFKAHAGGPYKGVIKEDITFDASKSKGDITGYRWDVTGDGNWDTDWSDSPTFTFSFDASYSGSVTVMIKDNDGNNDTATASIEVTTANNPPKITTIEGPDVGYANTSITINVSATDPDNDRLTYTIDWGDGSSPTSITGDSGTILQPSYTYTIPGWYTITVTVKDPSNALDGDDHFIIISEGEIVEDTSEKSGGFPFLFIIIIGIIIAIAILVYYLYQNDKLPIKKQSSNDMKKKPFNSILPASFKKDKLSKNDSSLSSSPHQLNRTTQSIPQPTQSSELKEKQKPFSKPKPFIKHDTRNDSNSSSDKQSMDGSNEFKRL
jgi:hypothetical protein